MTNITIIITTFNSEKTILRTINSILSQDGIGNDFHVELIVVDDCSSDDTLKILKENSIEYISTGRNSGGPNKGRNIGLANSTGDFICITDHDDEWLPDKLKSQLAVSHLAPIISCGYTEINEATGFHRNYVNRSDNECDYRLYPDNKTFISHLTRIHQGQVAYIGGLMFHHSLNNILFEEKYSMVDYDWFLRLFHRQTSVEICRALYIRRISGNNLSLNESYRLNDYHHSLSTLDGYRSLYPDEVRKASKRINGTMGRYYYKMEKMKEARKYFLQSEKNLKMLAYLITSICGYKWVNNKFKVF